MSKRYEKLIIENIESVNCSDQEVKQLVYLYERLVRKVAALRAKKIYFDLDDFANTKNSDLRHFKLIVVRNIKKDEEIYSGLFDHKNKTLSLNAKFKITL